MLSIPSVKTSGHHLCFPRKWIKRYTEVVHWKSLNMYPCLTNRNLFFYFKQFHHHWKFLETLDFDTYQGFLFFVLYTVIPHYFNEFIYEIIKWNISKIKHHNYKVLNLQGTLFSVRYSEKDIWDIQDIKKTPNTKSYHTYLPNKHLFTEIRSLKRKFMVKKVFKNLLCSTKQKSDIHKNNRI